MELIPKNKGLRTQRMSRLKSIKKILLSSAKLCGVFDQLSNSSWRQHRLLILGYHGISLHDEHLWNPDLFMPAGFLRQRFEQIKQIGCTVLSLSEGVTRLYEGSLPPRSVTITFDDGGYDFYERALPILRQFNFPATVYLTTYYTLKNMPVFDVAVGYLLWKANVKHLDLETIVGGGGVMDLSSESKRKEVHLAIVSQADLGGYSADRKNKILSDMCKQLDIDFAEFCQSRILHLMNAEEIEQVTKAGIDVQLHGHRHRVPIEEELFNREIIDNRRIIEDFTGHVPQHFCYPSGDYHPNVFPWLENANVISATTCEPALSHRKSNRYLLPRLIDTSSLSDMEFEGWVVGASHFLPQRSH